MPRLANLLFWLTPVLLSGSVQARCEKNSLFSALEAGCSSRVSFCQHVLSPTVFSHTATSTVHVPSYATTVTVTRQVTTVTKLSVTTTKTIASTLTTTSGHTTETLEQCRPTETCGAVTADSQLSLREACTCILKKTHTVTHTDSLQTSTFTSYKTKITSAKIIASTTQVYPIATTTFPTKTAYNCITVPAPAQTCNNSGHEYAFYDLDKADVQNPVDEWNLETYKTKVPLYNGTDNLLGGDYGFYVDGKKRKRDLTYGYCNSDYHADRGYIYAPQTGNYIVSIPAYLQAAYFWLGPAAYSGYTESNTLLNATTEGHEYSGGPSASIFLKRGTYHPFRIAYRCMQYSYEFDFYINIERPDGLVMVGEYSDTGLYPDYVQFPPDPNTEYVYSKYVVRFGCGADAKKAPPFPDWGHET